MKRSDKRLPVSLIAGVVLTQRDTISFRFLVADRIVTTVCVFKCYFDIIFAHFSSFMFVLFTVFAFSQRFYYFYIICTLYAMCTMSTRYIIAK